LTTPTFKYTKQNDITFNKTRRLFLCGSKKICDKIKKGVRGLLNTVSVENGFSERINMVVLKKKKHK
jgi:hypothetical protein